MAKNTKQVVCLSVVFAALVISGITATALAGERIFPDWFLRAHSSEDKTLWGNRGVGPGGYFLGGPSRMAIPKGSGVTSHTVKKGECLWYIAGYKEIYGDPTKWPLIYQANQDIIKDPDLIYPGQVLRIPR